MTDLFQYADSRPQNYRNTDPITSRDAGRAAHKFLGDHHQAILSVLRRSGRPMACEEISDAMKDTVCRGKSSIWLDYVACGKRSIELIRAGLIERTTETHINKSGRSAFRLRIKQSQSHPAEGPKPTPL